MSFKKGDYVTIKGSNSNFDDRIYKVVSKNENYSDTVIEPIEAFRCSYGYERRPDKSFYWPDNMLYLVNSPRAAKEVVMYFDVDQTYKVTSGVLKGRYLSPYKVSKCGEWGFFKVDGEDYRIHYKHTTGDLDDGVEYPDPGLIEREAIKEMAEARIMSSEFIASEDALRIHRFNKALRSRTATNMAELNALRETTQTWEPVIPATLWYKAKAVLIGAGGAYIALDLINAVF